MRRLLLVLMLFCLAMPALAHDPYLEDDGDWGSFDDPYQVVDHTISYAFYGYLDNAEDTEVFQITFPEGDALLRVNLLVPVCNTHYRDFYPDYAVVSPDISEDDAVDVELPIDLPDGYRVFYSSMPEPQAERPTFVEPFGNTEFYDAPTQDLTVPVAGDYYIVVYDDDGQTGDYSMAPGHIEQFNNPMLETISKTATIRAGSWLHRDCDVEPEPEAVVAPSYDGTWDFLLIPISTILVVIIGITFGVATWRNRRKDS